LCSGSRFRLKAADEEGTFRSAFRFRRRTGKNLKKMRKLFTLFIFLISLPVSGQSPVDFYQYWFNDDISGAVSQSPASPSPSLTLSLEVPAGSLPGGLHALHIRFRDEDRRWSSHAEPLFLQDAGFPGSGKKYKAIPVLVQQRPGNSVSGETAGGGIIQLDEAIDVAGMPGGFTPFISGSVTKPAGGAVR
jgi:hypothetical protein